MTRSIYAVEKRKLQYRSEKAQEGNRCPICGVLICMNAETCQRHMNLNPDPWAKAIREKLAVKSYRFGKVLSCG